MARQQLVIVAAICLISSLVLLGHASGTGNTHAKENHNYTMQAVGERMRRDVMEKVNQLHEQKQQESQQPNALTMPAAARDETESPYNDKNDLLSNYGSSLKAVNIVKRAPSGFTGMRGKKQFELPAFSNNAAIDWNGAAYDNEEEDTEDELSGAERLKKATAAFYGVRGKKYTMSAEEEYKNLNEMLMKLEEARLREILLQHFLDRLAKTNEDQNDIVKRAPTGFTGMRGKRPLSTYDMLYSDFSENELPKRGPTTAFVGVRGKKDVDHQNFKRSPFDSRGKNQRFVDFSNKFVAVRGKKNVLDDDDVVDDDNNNLSAELTGETHAAATSTLSKFNNFPINHQHSRERLFVNTLPSLLYGSFYGKRTPSGFLGMRGKRAASTAYAATTADILGVE